MFKYFGSIVLVTISLCTFAKPGKIQPLPDVDGRSLYWTLVIQDEPDKLGRQTVFVFETNDQTQIRDQYDLYVFECGRKHYLYYEQPARNRNFESLNSIPIESNEIALYLYNKLCFL